MTGPWRLRRIRRAASGRDCCWHHGILGPGAGIGLDDEGPADVTIYEGCHLITAIQRSKVTPA
jgi:hypothetical protein